MASEGKSGDQTTTAQNTNMQLSKDELDRVTEVFKMYETGLREATIYPKVRELSESGCKVSVYLVFSNNLIRQKIKNVCFQYTKSYF